MSPQPIDLLTNAPPAHDEAVALAASAARMVPQAGMATPDAVAALWADLDAFARLRQTQTSAERLQSRQRFD